jgi:hypothetical protein
MRAVLVRARALGRVPLHELLKLAREVDAHLVHRLRDRYSTA